MTKTELTLIIESHNKWLNCEPDGKRADLRDVNLSGADLRGANLHKAELNGAVIDFSCLPLWCGSLGAFFDDRQIIQLVYHTVKSGLQSKNTSEEVKNELTKLIDLANRFHRVGECGKITVPFDKPLTSR